MVTPAAVVLRNWNTRLPPDVPNRAVSVSPVAWVMAARAISTSEPTQM